MIAMKGLKMFSAEDEKSQNVYEKVMESVAGCLAEAAVMVGKQAGRLSESVDVDDMFELGKDKMMEFADFVHEPMGPPPYSDDETAACFLIFIGKMQRVRMKSEEIAEKWSSPQQFLQDVTTLSVMTDQTWGSAYKSILDGADDD